MVVGVTHQVLLTRARQIEAEVGIHLLLAPSGVNCPINASYSSVDCQPASSSSSATLHT
jgi:hypothetical protein